MKKLSLILISLIFLSGSIFASTYSSDPKMFVSELVNDAISKLSDKNLTKEEKTTFIENVAIENVDINALGLYTLGELRKSTDKNILESYQEAFKKYFLKSLTSRLTDYSTNKFEIIEAEKKSVNYTIVKSKIIANDNQPEMIIGNLAGGISYFSSDSIFYDTTIVEINNSTLHNKINIFPNPTKKNFTIFSNSVGSVNILDIKGKIIYSAIKKDYKLKINNANLPKGVYIVKLNKNIQKLIIK